MSNRRTAYRGVLIVTTSLTNQTTGANVSAQQIFRTKAYDTPGKARGQLTVKRKQFHPSVIVDAYTEEATEWTRID